MLLVAVLSGFVLAFVAPWLHRRVPPDWSGWVIAALPAALAIYFYAQPAAAVRIEAYDWVPGLGVRLSFALDGLSRLFALLVTGIGALVFIYAGAYMAGDERLGRLYVFLLAFMGSMLGLVLADNVLALFVFWELTSITSFALIGFDHQRSESRGAALQALFVTGGGGLALLAGLLLLGHAGGSLELSTLATRGDEVRAHAFYTPLTLLVLLGAFTKSAQVPFHFWLPNAMAAPTPVSAYLHSSTMVKAGVYLLARVSPSLGETALWQWSLGLTGAVTMMACAAIALTQTDLKRILAYSTVSALGVITMLLGLGGTSAATAAIVFLLAHAFYKGALFLVAGAITHATHERDVRKISGLRRAMPITATAAGVAALSMAGVPLLVGFVGKELLIDAASHAEGIAGPLFTVAAVITSVLLVAVAFIAGVKPFTGEPVMPGAHEGPAALWLGPVLLGALALAAGIMPALLDPLIAAAVEPVTGQKAPVHLVLWHGWNLPLALGLLALVLGMVLYANAPAIRETLRHRLPRVSGPDLWYAWTIDALNRVADVQTRTLQNGILRRYLLIVVVTTLFLAGAAFLRTMAPPAIVWTDVRPQEAAVAATILLGAAGVVGISSRLGAVAAVGAVGFGVALLFAMFGAPDLAMTQFVIEAILVILFVFVFWDVPASTAPTPRSAKLRDATVALAMGVLMAALVLVATTVQLQPAISGYFLDRAVPDAHGHNVVNVILVDFRAMDTLGEISVLAIAAVGVYALLNLKPAKEPQ